MAKLSEKEWVAWEKTRDLNVELSQVMDEIKRRRWARKTEFLRQPDGSVRRLVTRRDGTVEKEETIPAEKVERLGD
ncbi:MAG: hypothetical protein HY879_03415 [Deltaproteobacteria bacterium]|nr:hypothetical protein [Deltaproteobacteria bacterium]